MEHPFSTERAMASSHGQQERGSLPSHLIQKNNSAPYHENQKLKHQKGQKMKNKAIKRIIIRELHHHLDIDISFNKGLNVIYGKNGKGKTTLLHVLANVLELDFKRFRHLQFRKIYIESFESKTIELTKDASGRLRISLDGIEAGSYERADSLIPDLSPVERQAIKYSFGGRPVYLPAFRAILERVRSSSYGETVRDEQISEIKESEIQAIKESGLPPPSTPWQSSDAIAALIARKTVQCREWFGDFVPIIRYPSLIEVSESISAEYFEAQFAVSQSERNMLSSMFIDVFKALVSSVEPPSDGEIEPLMQRVIQSLDVDENTSSAHYTDYIGNRLYEEVNKAKEISTREQSEAQRRVLKLYAEMLERRNQERTEAFNKVKKFEEAVNLFLDGKTLHVSDQWSGNKRRIRESVYIETGNGKKYPLTSLSSGERQILTMLFSATRMSTTAPGVFLIDEPELSLHIDWQRIILGVLSSQATNRQIIACTHSPEVGADHGDAVQMFLPVISSSEAPLPGMDGENYSLDDLI